MNFTEILSALSAMNSDTEARTVGAALLDELRHLAITSEARTVGGSDSHVALALLEGMGLVRLGQHAEAGWYAIRLTESGWDLVIPRKEET
jgi:hypothetical protein